MTTQAVADLASTGILRAAINLSNFLLVSGHSSSGQPEGVAPDMALAIAARLGVPVRYVPFEKPGEVVETAGTGMWDVGLIGAEPARAEKIAFTDAYAEIECTFLVPAGSSIMSIAEIDQPGIHVSSFAGAAYDLWLDRNIVHAKLEKAKSIESSLRGFLDKKLDALAGLRPRLTADAESIPGAKVLEGCFSTVQQAIGTDRKNQAGATFLQAFVQEAKRSGLVARLIAKHDIRGLSVAA